MRNWWDIPFAGPNPLLGLINGVVLGSVIAALLYGIAYATQSLVTK